ncbi:L-lactate dehydrogenase (fragment) [uncultured Desulfatiglans sp.]
MNTLGQSIAGTLGGHWVLTLIMIVSNPVDILTYVAIKISGYPMNRIIGSGTSLDTARFRFLLSQHCQVDPRNVNAYIIGEHGDSEVPVWSQVNIAGLPLSDYCTICGKNCSMDEKKSIFDQVKNAAYEIINRKGYTNFAIALALVKIINSILRDENSVLTVSSLIDNYYDLNNLFISIPCVLNKNGISKQIRINLHESEKYDLQSSGETIKSYIDKIDI